jgi:uncharacterized protein YndB with AHSA1/START domain
MKNVIEISTHINKNLKLVWDSWIKSDHIKNWNFASDEWGCPSAVIDFKEQGHFSYRMEAKDQSFGFDYSGVFKKIVPFVQIHFVLDDGREVTVDFSEIDSGTKVVECFEPESENSRDLQEQGWKAILENFKKYTETL